jgi:hypothetical protein
MQRNRTGNWCGYVRLAEGVAALEGEAEWSLEVHGGITWNKGGEVGWDTCHNGDFVPAANVAAATDPMVAWMAAMLDAADGGQARREAIVWTFDAVVEETNKLAAQVCNAMRD